MDPPRFINHYRPLFTWLRRCGLSKPWLQGPSRFLQFLYIGYNTAFVVTVTFTLCMGIYTIASTSVSFQDLCVLGITNTVFACGLLLTIYHMLFSSRLKKMTEAVDSVTETILQSELGGTEFLRQIYQKNAKLMTTLTNASLFFSLTTPLLYNCCGPLMDWLNGHYRTNLPSSIVTPYNKNLPVTYVLTVLQIGCSIAISTAKKSVTDCLFISLLNTHTAFLKYLCESKGSLETDIIRSDEAIRRKIVTWAAIHQIVLKNTEELIAIFSPVIIIYKLCVINVVVFGAFVQIKRDNDSLVQSVSMGSYVVTTILYYFLLSNIADGLNTEAQKLGFVAYNMPWYKTKSINSDVVRMVLLRSNRQIQVTAYSAPIFKLNRESFGEFMISATSAFVTFCQLKDRYG